MSSTSIPAEAVGLVAGVLAYSTICLSTSLLLYITLIIIREYTNYITLLAGFISISTAASVSQQIDYSINWRTIKEREFEESTSRPSDSLQLAHVYGNQAIFFWIQYYCYNVDALLLLFWSINLAKKMWNPSARQSHTRVIWPSIVAKVSSIVLPAILIAIVQLDFVLERRILQIILGNLCMELSFTFGSIVVVASLIRYLINRKTLTYGSNYSNGRKGSVNAKSSPSMEDRWIIFRFTAAFVILSAFGVWLVVFQLLQSDSKDQLVESAEPNLSFDDIKEDVLTFVPGVTASLGCFILFGTTKPLRQRYASWFHSVVSIMKRVMPSRLQTCCYRERRGQQRIHARELQKSSTVAADAVCVNGDSNLDVEQAYRNADYVISSTLSSAVRPSTLPRSIRNNDEFGSTVELNQFAVTPDSPSEPGPLVSPHPPVISTLTNFSVPMSPEHRQRRESHRHYFDQSPTVPNYYRGPYNAIG